jgi:uncharacterized protein YbbK (DUF523 family)
MILISSCLLGIHAKYDGGNNYTELLARYAKLGKYLPVCPEQLGGLTTPRQPVEIVGGSADDVLNGRAKAVTVSGVDVSGPFIKGAQEVAAIARNFPVTAAILKERSPSCGVSSIYDGSFGHVVIRGQGVTALLLKELGIPVYSETEVAEELLLRLLAAG